MTCRASTTTLRRRLGLRAGCTPATPSFAFSGFLLRSRVLHATVLQCRGAYAAAIQELTTCGEEAEGQGWAALAAFAYQHRGKVFYDTDDFVNARADFKRALFLRQEAGAPEDELESTLVAIEAAERRRSGAPVAS